MYDWDYVLAIKAVLLKEEQVTDDDGGDDAGEIGNQSARHGIPRFGDTYAAEIHSKDIERSIRSTACHAAHTADE